MIAFALFFAGFAAAQQTCSDRFSMDYSFCARVNQINVYNYSLCEYGCSVAECCRELSTCNDARGMYNIDFLCRMESKVVNDSAACSGAQCSDTSVCCRGPENCYEADMNNRCANISQLVNMTASCSGSTCDEVNCCRLPEGCGEASFLYSLDSLCRSNRQFLNYSGDCSGAECDSVAQCCSTPTDCNQASSVYDVHSICRSYSQFYDPWLPCSGASCGMTACCRPPQGCYEANNVYYLDGLCRASQQLVNFSATSCVGAACNTVDECCREPADCSEAANPLNLWSVCPAMQQILDYSGACSDNCSIGCCRLPANCQEGAAIYPISSTCANEAQVFNRFGLCSGANCGSPTQCCVKAQTCDELGQSMQYMYPSASARCYQLNGGVFNTNNSCSAGGCSLNDCCSVATECYHVAYLYQYSCRYGLVYAYDLPCSNCSSDTCCVPPRTCGELMNTNNYFCQQASNQVFKQDNISFYLPCSGGCTANSCCRDARTCGEYAMISGTNVCAPQSLLLNYPQACSGSADCTSVARCCTPPRSCNELRQVNGNPSQFCGVGNVWNDTDYWAFQAPCAGGSCSPDECCEPISNCGQAGSVNSNLEYQYCRPSGQIFDHSKSCSTCTTECCKAPTNCFEQQQLNYNFCSGVGQIFNSNFTTCSGACDTQDCCRPPTNCNEASTLSSSLGQSCQASGKFLSFSPCTTCDVSQCCSEPTSCYEVSLTFPMNYCPSGLIFNLSGSCNNATCSPSKCCALPTTCSETVMARFDFCSKTNLISNQQDPGFYYPCVGNCTVQRCCRAPSMCYEADFNNQLGDTCASRNLVLDYSKSCTNCDSSTCCKMPQSCGEANLYSACGSLGKQLNYYRNCSGATCTASVCCDAITDCNQYLSLDRSVCPRIGKIAPMYYTSTNCTGACTAAQCCDSPVTCSDANQLSGDKLCLNRGVVNYYMNCSGAGCTPDVCCQAPSSCSDALVSASDFCWRLGFVDQNSRFCIGSSCNPATCCRAPSTCSEWKHVWDKNSVHTIVRPEICGTDTFDRYGACQGGICDEKSCCRPPTTCGEANFDVFCSGYVKKNEPCSGASCTVATCCATPTTCAEVALNFLTCFGVSKYPNPTGSCGGLVPCDTAQCCRAPKSCSEVLVNCPVGSFLDGNMSCSGSTCGASTCCQPLTTCFDAINNDPNFCKGFGFPVPKFTACSGSSCTQSQCCRSIPSTCGEAAIKSPAFCGGAVDFFKLCSGTQCADTSYCCRPASNCDEALKSGAVVCGANQIPANQLLASCPSAGCSSATCCKPVASCGDANVEANGMLCSGLNSVVSESTMCTGSCLASTCCRAPITCGEATDASSSFCSGSTPIVNVQAQTASCNPTCTQSQCCRAPVSCADALTSDPTLCSKTMKVINFGAATSPCTACATQCCTSEPSFAPSPAPTSQVVIDCPRDAFNMMVSKCNNTDFVSQCSSDCNRAAVALILAFKTYNVSSAKDCLDQALMPSPLKFTSGVRDYIVRQVKAQIALCADEIISSAPILSYSVASVSLLVFTALF